jgi:cell division protein YceG involved in septum cleavage/poly-gamma-glutamate capsule biosynthesis protein CapA/YwtB (metallophosphatase superfamily)/N-acetylmuramoyl-L-alanine amidase
MSDRELRGMGGFVLLFVAIALVAGAGWRSAAPESDSNTDAEVAVPAERRSGPAALDAARHFTIQPGWRAEQIATALEATGLGDGHRFMALVRDPAWAKLHGPEWSGARTLEGYLAPGVYDAGPGFSETTLLRAMLERFEDEFTPAMVRRAGELGLTVAEAVTLASIVEREKVFASEAPVIAAVYHNRLRARMPLQADPTVLYALETAENRVGDRYWVRGLSRSALRVDSPYNTYRHTGLPPGPIASPSRQTLLAVLYPAAFDYRFFVARGDNTHYFSRGYAAHLRNIARYRSGDERRPSSGTELQRLVDRVVHPLEAHAGVVVKNLTTGELATRNADEFFTAASLYKLAVLLKAFEQRERGRLRFADRIEITPDAAATDVLEVRRRLGRNPTVAAALREMIVVSSNAAGVTFLNRFGRGSVEQLLREHRVQETSLRSLRLVTTPRDVARLLELIARGRAVDPRASAAMLRLLSRQRIRDRLPRFLPKGVRIAHKTGNIDYPSHDAGVLFTRRGPVVVVAMTEGAKNPARATEMIAELGRIVFDYFEHYRPAVGRRDAVADWACPDSPFQGAGRGALAGRTIVLDPGHGGHDPGAEFRFRDGFLLREKDVVLDVSLRLKDLLVARGATVYLTRCRDVFVPRMARAALANGVAPDLLLSVHVNGSPKPGKDGTEIYYFHNEGRRLANYLLGTFSRPALWESLSTRRTLPNRGVHRRQFDVLTFTLAPAALTESLFMTNPGEARLLRDMRRVPTARRQQIALGHLRGLLNYFGRGVEEDEDSVTPPPVYQAPRRAEVTIAAVGDIAMGSTPVLPAGGGATLFSAVAPQLAADVTIGNLEGTLALGGESKCGSRSGGACFAFRTPPWYAYWLRRAGFHVLNLANNHSADFGAEGTAGTIDALDNSGLLHTGRPGQVARLQVGLVRVAVVGFAPYPWAQSLLDVSAAQQLISKADEWADVVVVTMHAGGEGADWMHVSHAPEVYLGEPRGDPVAFAHTVVDAGADLVVGHGPHVLRGMEWYRGRLIAYSLGNFAAHRTLSTRGSLGLGAILRARLRADGSWAGGKLVGTRLVTTGTPVEDRSGSASRLVRTLSSEDFGLSAATVTPDARILGPVSARVTRPVRPSRPAPPPRGTREFEIVATGDILIHRPIAEAARRAHGGYEFRPMFAEIRPVVRRAALALCHIETSLGAGPPSSFPRLNAPAELADAIAWTGWDACSTASNHSADFGQLGIDATAQELDRAGIEHTGSFRSPAEARRILIKHVRGVDIAFLSYTGGTNRSAPAPWSLNFASVPKITADARRARRLGAELVLLNLHSAQEYVHEPTPKQRYLARALLRRGTVDAIVGQHAHVVQPIRRLFGRFVVYGEGNLLSNQTAACCPPETQDGLIAILRVRARGRQAKIVGVDYVPVRVRHPEFVVEPVASALRTVDSDSRRAAELRESFRRTVAFAGAGDGVRPNPAALPPETADRVSVRDLSPLEKARLLVVSGPPYSAGVGGVFVGRSNRRSVFPRGALVFADQEGEPVKAFANLPPWSPAAAYTDPAWAFAEGQNTGRALHYAGVHVDLAPVLDAATGPLDERHFRRPSLALAFAKGLAAGGTAACVKHFPGLGSTPISTDVGQARGRVVASEVARFRAAIGAGVKCVMVGHAVYSRLGRKPASFEPATYALLRASGFRGVAITDDLDALGREEAARSARLAAAAGADLLLFTSGADARRAIAALVPLAREGRLDDSVARVLRLRRAYGLTP